MHKVHQVLTTAGVARRVLMLELRVQDGAIVAYASHDDTDGVPFAIKGVTWGGAEGGEDRRGETIAPPIGLQQWSMDEIFATLARHKFNLVRVTLSHLAVLRNNILVDDFNAAKNPSLAGTHYLSMLQEIAKAAAAHGILIVVAVSRLAPSDILDGLRERNPPGRWYSKFVGSEFSGWEMAETTTLQSWRQLSDALCKQWNVVGADLMSRLSHSTWGAQQTTDWDLAAARIGNHVLAQCPRWLVFVRGIGATPAVEDAFIGANLAGAATTPVILDNPEKLVYVARVRGPSEGQRKYFDGARFPGSLEDVFERQWAAIPRLTGARSPACKPAAFSGLKCRPFLLLFRHPSRRLHRLQLRRQFAGYGLCCVGHRVPGA